MDSASLLRERGLASWMAFTKTSEREVIGTLPSSHGVYVILLGVSEPRRRGMSDIAYIGKAGNQNGLRGRVRQYYHPGPTQRTSRAMNERLCAPGCVLRIGVLTTGSASEAALLESELLDAFEREHEELPPHNRQRGRRLPKG